MASVLAVMVLALKPKEEETKAKINKWDDIQLTSCRAKETIQEVRSQPMKWGEIPAKHISDQGLLCEELIQLKGEKHTQVI